MSSNFEKFKDLHHSPVYLFYLTPGTQKAPCSSRKKNFPPIATSSAAVATSLGYEDGEEMPFADYLFIIKRILSAVQIPLSVDIETGYGKSNEEIYTNIQKLIDLGVVGINIEDSIIHKSGRVLKDAKDICKNN